MSRDERDVFTVLRKASAASLRGTRMLEQAVGLYERAAPDEAADLEMDLFKASERLPAWAQGVGVDEVAALRPPIQAAVADVLGEREAVGALIELEGMALDRAAVKAVSHALTTLRGRGLAPPPAPRGGGLLAAPVAPPREISAYCSPADSRGQSLILIVETTPGGALVHSGMLDETLGFAGFGSMRTTRKGAREIVDYYFADPGLLVAEVPIEYAVHLLVAARARAVAAREALNQAVLSLLSSLPVDLVEHSRGTGPVEFRIEPPPDPEAAMASLLLLGVPAVRGWGPPRAGLDLLRPKIEAAAASSLVVAGATPSQRMVDLFVRGLGELLDAGWRATLVARARHLGLLAANLGHGQLTYVALGTAEALGTRALPPEKIPFVTMLAASELRVRELVVALKEAGLWPVALEGQGGEAQDASAPTETPESGLIVPGR